MDAPSKAAPNHRSTQSALARCKPDLDSGNIYLAFTTRIPVSSTVWARLTNNQQEASLDGYHQGELFETGRAPVLPTPFVTYRFTPRLSVHKPPLLPDSCSPHARYKRCTGTQAYWSIQPVLIWYTIAAELWLRMMNHSHRVSSTSAPVQVKCPANTSATSHPPNGLYAATFYEKFQADRPSSLFSTLVTHGDRTPLPKNPHNIHA